MGKNNNNIWNKDKAKTPKGHDDRGRFKIKAIQPNKSVKRPCPGTSESTAGDTTSECIDDA